MVSGGGGRGEGLYTINSLKIIWVSGGKNKEKTEGNASVLSVSVHLIYLYISVSIILVKEGCAHAREKLGVIERPLWTLLPFLSS